MFCVYVFQHKQNHKIYVGKTNNFIRRVAQHKSRSLDTYFSRSIEKYGLDAFDYFILEEFENEENCFEAEEFWIAFFRSNVKGYGYNLTEGGEGTSGHTWTLTAENKKNMSEAHRGHSLSEQHKQAISESLQGAKNPNYGKTMSENQKILISGSRKGKLAGMSNPSAKLNMTIAHQIRNEYESVKSARKLAKKYELSQSTILNIINRKYWVD